MRKSVAFQQVSSKPLKQIVHGGTGAGDPGGVDLLVPAAVRKTPPDLNHHQVPNRTHARNWKQKI